jgi:hypothetical protein
VTPSCIPKNGQLPNSFVNIASTQTYSYRNGEGQGQLQDGFVACACYSSVYACAPGCKLLSSQRLSLVDVVAVTCAGLWNASCENGRQLFRGYGWPGLLTTHPTGTADTSIRGKFVVPANLHIGNMGVAPKFPARPVNSIPPSVSLGAP